MEAARLGLHEYQLGALRPGLTGLEPWLGPPLSTLTHVLPGFMSHPQAAYASYLSPPIVSSALGLPPALTAAAAAAPHLLPSHTPPSAAALVPPPAPASPANSEGGGGSSSGRISPGSEATPQNSSSNTPVTPLGHFPFPFSTEQRISSINALRLKAKEQLDLFKENGFTPR